MHGYNTRRMSRLATARSRQLTVNGGDSTAPGTASNGPRRGEDQNQLSVVPSTNSPKKHSEAIIPIAVPQPTLPCAKRKKLDISDTVPSTPPQLSMPKELVKLDNMDFRCRVIKEALHIILWPQLLL